MFSIYNKNVTSYHRFQQEFVFILFLFLSNSKCEEFNVCCDSANTTTPIDIIFTSNNGSYEDKLNRSGVELLKQFNCGITNTNRVSFGNQTRIAEYPWMALLLYDNHEQPFQCGGSLISKRYVVTAAHCMVKTRDTLIGVRLGEHDTDKKGGCLPRGKHCICYESKNYGIEKTIPHPNYNRIQYINDVGLIRLNRSVEFEEHIKPICLPITNKAAQLDKYPVKYTIADKQSKKLFKVETPSKPRIYCQNIFKRSNIKIEHICASGESRVDSCKGDSGSPIYHSSCTMSTFPDLCFMVLYLLVLQNAVM